MSTLVGNARRLYAPRSIRVQDLPPLPPVLAAFGEYRALPRCAQIAVWSNLRTSRDAKIAALTYTLQKGLAPEEPGFLPMVQRLFDHLSPAGLVAILEAQVAQGHLRWTGANGGIERILHLPGHTAGGNKERTGNDSDIECNDA
jgi:hypothetical protein